MKAIYDSNFKKLMERPDQVIILTGYSLVPKEGEEKFSKEIYTVSNKNILEVYINTSELDGYTIKETAEGFEKDSDRKEVNSIKLFYKLEGEVYPETLPYVLIKFDGPTRLDSGNNLLKIKFPETFKAKIKGLGFNRDINFLEGVGSDKVMNILYLDSINDVTTEYSVSKDSYYKYLLKRENTNLSDFSWKDEEGKFQTENYIYRVYDESTFEVGVSDMMSLNKISTKLHLFVDKDGVVKVRGVIRYTEYQVSNGGDPVEICSGLADVTGIDGVEIKLDEIGNNFRYSIVNSLSNISYYAYKGTISSEMKISEYPYGIFHMELTYRDKDGYKTIKSNKFRLIQSGMVEIFSVFKNTEYSEGNIPVYLLERNINSNHDFYATLMTDFSVSDLKSNTFFIFEGDNLENGEIIGGEYKEYMESIFKITPTISTVEEGLLKISVVLSTKTTNDKPYWLPHPVDKSIPIKVTMRIQANDDQYDYSFYIIQKADVDDIEAHNDNGPKKSEFWIPEKGGTIDIAVSLEEDIYSEGEKDISSLYWRILETKVPHYIITKKKYVPVLDRYGNPVYFTEDSELIPEDIRFPELSDVGKLNMKIPNASLNWPSDFKRFHVSYPYENQITDDKTVAVYKLSLLSKDSYPNGDEKISLTDWRFVASSSVIEITIKQHKQTPFVKIYTSDDKSTEITDQYDVREVNSYPMYIESNVGKLIFESEGNRDYLKNDFALGSFGDLSDEEKEHFYKNIIKYYGDPINTISSDLDSYTVSCGEEFDSNIEEFVYFNVNYVLDFSEDKKTLGKIKIYNSSDKSKPLKEINIVELGDWEIENSCKVEGIPEIYYEFNGEPYCKFVDFGAPDTYEYKIHSDQLDYICLIHSSGYGHFKISSKSYVNIRNNKKITRILNSSEGFNPHEFSSGNVEHKYFLQPSFGYNKNNRPGYLHHKLVIDLAPNFCNNIFKSYLPINVWKQSSNLVFFYCARNGDHWGGSCSIHKNIIPMLNYEEIEFHTLQYCGNEFRPVDSRDKSDHKGYHMIESTSSRKRVNNGPESIKYYLPRDNKSHNYSDFRTNVLYAHGAWYPNDFYSSTISGTMVIGMDFLKSFNRRYSKLDYYRKNGTSYFQYHGNQDDPSEFKSVYGSNASKRGSGLNYITGGKAPHGGKWFWNNDWHDVFTGYTGTGGNNSTSSRGDYVLYWTKKNKLHSSGIDGAFAITLGFNNLSNAGKGWGECHGSVGAFEFNMKDIDTNKDIISQIYLYPWVDLYTPDNYQRRCRDTGRGVSSQKDTGLFCGQFMSSREESGIPLKDFINSLSRESKYLLYYYAYGQFRKLAIYHSNVYAVSYNVDRQYSNNILSRFNNNSWDSYIVLKAEAGFAADPNTLFKVYSYNADSESTYRQNAITSKYVNFDSILSLKIIKSSTYYNIYYKNTKELDESYHKLSLNDDFKNFLPQKYKISYYDTIYSYWSELEIVHVKGIRYCLRFLNNNSEFSFNVFGDGGQSLLPLFTREVNYDTRSFEFTASKYDISTNTESDISIELLYIPNSIEDIIEKGDNHNYKLKFPVNNTSKPIVREYKLFFTTKFSDITDEYDAIDTNIILSITQKPYSEIFEVILPDSVKADEYNPLYFQVDGSCNMLEGNNSFRIKSNNNNLEKDLKVTDSLDILSRFIVTKTSEDIENNLYYYTVTLLCDDWIGSHDYNKSIGYLSISIGSSEKKRLFYKQEYIHLAVKKANSHRTYDNDENLEEELIYYHIMKCGYYDKTQSKFVENTIDIDSNLILNGDYTPNGEVKKVYSSRRLSDGDGNVTYKFKDYSTEDYGTIDDVDFKLITRKDDTDYDPPALQDEAIKNSSAGEDTQVEYSVETSVIFGLSSITEFLGNSPMIQWMKNNLQEDPEFNFKINYKITLK